MALADAVPFAVAAWDLDEPSGSALDQVGSNDLAETGGTIDSTTGILGNARDFEAADTEHFEIADNTDLSTGNIDFMVRCWVKFESLSGTGVLIAKGLNVGDFATLEYSIYSDSSPNIHFRVADGSAVGTATWSSAPSTGVWYLVHGWHDSVNNQVGIAVNAGTAVLQSWSSGVSDLGGTFRIGDDGTAVRYLDGLLDDVVLLKGYILDATERTEDYNGGAGVAFADWDGVEEPRRWLLSRAA